jgi:hypothetical protein
MNTIENVRDRAAVHNIPPEIYEYEHEDFDDQVEIDKMNTSSELLLFLAENEVKRGDIIFFSGSGHRNDYGFIYDGCKVSPLCWDGPKGYDYGIVPPTFPCIREFPIDYWVDALQVWLLVWIPWNDERKHELLDNIQYVDEYTFRSYIFIDDNVVTVYISHTNEDKLTQPLLDFIERYISDFLRDGILAVDAISDEGELPEGAAICHIISR